jgi:2-polyprenyl-3-methyl-5-hydroxy-6-metoxy-1,4-benzoquinol methylase
MARKRPDLSVVGAGGETDTRSASTALEYTGERHIPGLGGGAIALEHEHRYALAGFLASGLSVLDIGCGEGYGSARLSATASSVIGIDIDPSAIAHAQSSYGNEQLSFATADAEQLPFDDDSFDLAVAFEVIEHVRDPRRLLCEARRVLHRDGLLFLSTPNRLVAVDADPDINVFHRRWLSASELTKLVGETFVVHQLLGQLVSAASFAWDTRRDASSYGDVRALSTPVGDPKYLMVVASTGEQPPRAIEPSLYSDATQAVIREREQFWQALEDARLGIHKREEEAQRQTEALETQRRSDKRALDAARLEIEHIRSSLLGAQRAELDAQTRLAEAISQLEIYRRTLERQRIRRLIWRLGARFVPRTLRPTLVRHLFQAQQRLSRLLHRGSSG